MGSGIDEAAKDNPEMANALDDMKDQLILVLVNRLGGDINIPVSEIDSTGQYIMYMEVKPDESFQFITAKKS